MIEKIRGLFDRSLAIAIGTRGHELGRLFSDFLEAEIPVSQESLSVARRYTTI
jgi:hypothetical protein